VTAPVVPDAEQDPAGYVLAVADLREKRAKAAIPGPYEVYQLPERSIASAQERVGLGVAGDEMGHLATFVGWGEETAVHMAAEANPAHARDEVALWRGVAARHTSRSGKWCDWCGSKPAVHAVWPCPDLLAVVAAARAYLTGAGG
jgi:hypothetical protein